MKFYANLHLHSTHSDGIYTPAELVKIAKEEGYKAIAISDHDTASAYPELLKACNEEDMECIFAVEFTVMEPYDFHIVAFDFDPEYPPMKEYLEKMALRQTDNTKKCFDEAVELGRIKGITWEEILEFNKGIPWLCNNHVFRAMKSKGLVQDSEYINWFYTNIKNQRAKFKPLYNFKCLQEIVKLVKEAGGFAVCAHPKTEQLDRFELLIESGIEGLEVFHPQMTKEEQERAYKLCIENNLYISGGTDHNGLCGGLYKSYSSEEELKASSHYIEPLSAGTYEQYFREIQNRKINRSKNRSILNLFS